MTGSIERGPFLSAPERPIETLDDDALERGEFVTRLSRALIDEKSQRSTGVIVGITGPWGSGKSSVLNLLHQYIVRNYPKVIVVRFDPWLVSGRDDLVDQFFAEFVGAIRGKPGLLDKGKKLAEAIASYGAHLAPIADLKVPGLGSIIGGGLKAFEKALDRKKSLQQQRDEIREHIADLDIPILVFIDELDRVEDAEIRAIAQLVRAIVDFRGVSYVLAYDPDRVIEALGHGKSERGRAYLEKIVQLPFPLPIAFDDELHRLLEAELVRADHAGFPADWKVDERYQELRGTLIPGLISTPRDVSRLAGAFSVLEPMLRGEVDWRDLLGYCALLIKAPGTAERIRKEPDLVCDMPATSSAMMRRMEWDKKKIAERITEVAPDDERTPERIDLLKFLFPAFNDEGHSGNQHPEALYRRTALLTTLRLGLLPGHFSREEIIGVLKSPQSGIESFLRSAIVNGNLMLFSDRLQPILSEIGGIDHLTFWLAVGNVFKRTDAEWPSDYSQIHEFARGFAKVFERLNRFGGYPRSQAHDIFYALLNGGDITITSLLLRSHLFWHGLFGQKQGRESYSFLNGEETQDLIVRLSQQNRASHLEGNWVASLWSLDPVYTMIDAKIWDDACRKRLVQLLDDDRAVVGLALMNFGGSYTVSRETLETLVGAEHFVARVRSVLNAPSISLSKSAEAALKKAAEERW